MSRSDGPGDLLERRWFAAQNACTTQRHECDHTRQSLEAAELAWRRSHARLRQLEALRDELGQQLAEADFECERTTAARVRRALTAA